MSASTIGILDEAAELLPPAPDAGSRRPSFSLPSTPSIRASPRAGGVHLLGQPFAQGVHSGLICPGDNGFVPAADKGYSDWGGHGVFLGGKLLLPRVATRAPTRAPPSSQRKQPRTFCVQGCKNEARKLCHWSGGELVTEVVRPLEVVFVVRQTSLQALVDALGIGRAVVTP
jgi:hypothetical protein